MTFDNIRDIDNLDDTELRTSLQTAGWNKHLPAIKDENGNVLVGHRRLKIAAEENIEPVIKVVKFGTGPEADAERMRLAVVSNIGSAPLTKKDRKALAERLYDQGRGLTMAAIAAIVGVTEMTISRDLADVLTDVRSSREPKTDTRGRKNTGRPKGPPKPRKAHRNPAITPEVEASVASDVLDKGIPLKQAAKDRGVGSEQVAKVAVAKEQGRREAMADPEIDVATFSMSQKEKFDAAIRQYKRKLDLEYDQRRTNEIREHLDGYLLPLYRKKLAEAEAVIKGRKGVMSRKDWELIRRCVHPDNSASEEMRNRAFDLWMGEKLKLVILAEKDNRTDAAPPLPKTAAEWMARKAAVDAERRAARAAKKSGATPAAKRA